MEAGRRAKENRGPAAAAANRRALLDAARRLFADRGYRVPLKAIATEAGVGQGVLYRHFPTRLELAFAVFEEHLVELEAIAAEDDDEAFGRVWARVVASTVSEAAFVEMAVDARHGHPGYDGLERLRRLLAGPLERARRSGRVAPDLSVEDVLLAQRMVFGVVVTSGSSEAAADAVDRALGLLAPSGAWPRPRT